MEIPMRIRVLLDRHALPLIAGLAVALLDYATSKWPVLHDILAAAGISEGMVSAAVIGLASYGLAQLDPIWSNKSWRVQPESPSQ